MNLVGDVNGKSCLIVDDVMDTCRTVTEVSAVLKNNGAVNIFTCATHPVLSGGAIAALERSAICEVVVTDTIPLDRAKSSSKITVLSIAGLLGDAIRRIHHEESVSSLFV
jgi:ribose-phosphate pyrophosphokinase